MVFGDFSPELRLHIASFLDKSDAVSLAGAHSTWQDAAESVIWRNADMADVDVPDLWWTDDQLHKLDTHLRKSWVRLYDAIFSRPIRATMIRRLAFVPLNDTAGLAVELIRRCSANLGGLKIISLSPSSDEVDDAEIFRIYTKLATLPACPTLTCADLYLSSRWHLEVPMFLQFAPNLSDIRLEGDAFDDVDMHSAAWPAMPTLRSVRVMNLMSGTQLLVDKLLSVAQGVTLLSCEDGTDDNLDFSAIAEHDKLDQIRLDLEPDVVDAVIHRLSLALSTSCSRLTSLQAPFTNRTQPFVHGPNLLTVTWKPPTRAPRGAQDPQDPVLGYQGDLEAAQSGTSIEWLPELYLAPQLERIRFFRPPADGIDPALDTAHLDIRRHRAGDRTIYVLELWESLRTGDRYKAAGVVIYGGTPVPNAVWQQIVKLDELESAGQPLRGRGLPLSEAAMSLLRGERPQTVDTTRGSTRV